MRELLRKLEEMSITDADYDAKADFASEFHELETSAYERSKKIERLRVQAEKFHEQYKKDNLAWDYIRVWKKIAGVLGDAIKHEEAIMNLLHAAPDPTEH